MRKIVAVLAALVLVLGLSALAPGANAQGPMPPSVDTVTTVCYEGWAVAEIDYTGEVGGRVVARVAGRKAPVQVNTSRNGGYITVSLMKRFGKVRVVAAGEVIYRGYLEKNPCYPQQGIRVTQQGRKLQLNVDPHLPGRVGWEVRIATTDVYGYTNTHSVLTTGRGEKAAVVLEKGERPFQIHIAPGAGGYNNTVVYNRVGKGGWIVSPLP